MYSYIEFSCITGGALGCLCRAAWDLWDRLAVGYTSFYECCTNRSHQYGIGIGEAVH